MKKKLFILILFAAVLLMPSIVYAAGGSVELSCPSTSIPLNSSVTCTIRGSVEGGIAGADITLSNSGSVSISNLTKEDGWNGDVSENNIKVYDTAKESPASIGSVTVSANSDAIAGSTGTITLGTIELTDSEGNAVGVEDKTIEFTIGESNSSNGSNTSNVSNNPKTMDINTTIVICLLLFVSIAVIIGKKKLNKISK